MSQRGFLAKQEVPNELILTQLPQPPDCLANDQVAMSTFTKLADILSKCSVITEPMVLQMTTYALLESIKQKALSDIALQGSTCTDGRGRLSQNPMYPVYFSALREQRSILRDLGLIAPVGTKKKAVNIFTQFLEEDE
jgi:phage terminase small subunit